MENVLTVILEPNKPAYALEFVPSYKNLVKLVNMGLDNPVGGIEYVRDLVGSDSPENWFTICLNEEGKLHDLKPNRFLFLNKEYFRKSDLLVGTAIVMKMNSDGFAISLSKKEADKIITAFNSPERIADQSLKAEDFLQWEIHSWEDYL